MHLFRVPEKGKPIEYIGEAPCAKPEIRRSFITGSTVRQITKRKEGYELALVTFLPGPYSRQRRRKVVGIFSTEQEAEKWI